jgi:PAS domain S-box-containing protein
MHQRAIKYWGVSIVLGIILVIFRHSDWVGSINLHTIMETAATILALIVGALALVRFYSKKSNVYLFVGLGFVGAGLLDGYHGIVTAEFFREFMPSDSSPLSVWSWFASRLFLSVMLFMSWFGSNRKEIETFKYSEINIYIFSTLFLFSSFLFFAFVQLPAGYFPNLVGHRPQEFLPALLFSLTLIGYLKNGGWRNDAFEHWLVISLLVGIATQTFFMPFSSAVFDADFDNAHLLKIVSYVCALIGLLISTYGVYRNEAENSEKYSGIINNTAEAVITIDDRGLIETFNPSAERIFGYDAEESIGRNVSFLMTKNEQTEHDSYLKNSNLHSARIINQARALEGKRKDGTLFPLELTVSRMDIQGQQKFIGILHDITDRQKALAEIRQSEARFRDFTNAAGDRFWELDENYRFIYLSEITGAFEVKTDVLMGKTHDALNIELLDSNYTSFTEILALRRSLRNVHYKVKKHDGTELFIRESAIPLYDEGGKFTGYRGVAVNETAEVLEQKKNARVQERFKFAMDNLDVGFVLWDSDDRLVAYNSYFDNLTKEVIENLELGMTYQDYITEWVANNGLPEWIMDQEAWLQERLVQFKQPQNEFEVFNNLIGKWLHVVLQKISDGSTVIFYTDITQLHEREDELREAQRVAENANAAKSNFLSSMCHELRTPMNAILGFSQLLITSPDEKLSERQENFTAQIMKGGEHLLELIDQVLELSKIEAGKISLSIETVDVEPIIAECIAMLKGRAETADVSLVDKVAGIGLPYLKTDSGRLRQIMLNLLTNAIKYNCKDGFVTVASENLENGFLRLIVGDTGLGVPIEKQDTIFEPFNRLGRESGEIEGTGIGLTITRQFVELLGGNISFTSEEGKGSRFWIDLPIDTDRKQDDALEFDHLEDRGLKENASSLRKKKILYIEDNPSKLRLMEEVVHNFFDVKLLSAHTGELGMAMAEEHIPDLILLDINLPGMDGLEVMRNFKTMNATKDIPVIALTAAAMPREVERGELAGFSDYVTKPINIPVIVSSIKEVLGET